MPGTDTLILGHEGRLSALEEKVGNIDTKVNKIEGKADTIISLLQEDNNGKSITTRIALNTQSTKRLWWFVGALTLTIVGTIVAKFFGA